MKPAVQSVYDALFVRYPALTPCEESVAAAFAILRESYAGGGKLLACGNGGSASDAEHIVGELMKGFMQKRPLTAAEAQAFPATEEGGYLVRRLQRALPAISLVSQTSLMTAFANDVSSELVFAQQVFGYGRAGDVLLGLSTSGSSRNVVYAAHTARSLGVKSIGLTGRDGGRLKELCEVVIQVPADSTPEVQELHLPVYHALCMMLEAEFFESE